ncbi:hypothetical protein DSO57_1017481 [Entomophthora muscae]|uniref:Uncharacterized protein n=1 Tax=Entomophthora muscae TaxID=34485 RepID=A0ACC2RVX0_9FUNG|nr:hypothetical protein DSO57_1017481 [Entomophthora muscae]
MSPLTVLNLVLLVIPNFLAYPQSKLDRTLSDMRSGFARISSLRSPPPDPSASKQISHSKDPKEPPPYAKQKPKGMFGVHARTKVASKPSRILSTSKRNHPNAVLDMIFSGDDIPLKPALNTKTFPSDFETFAPIKTISRTIGYFQEQYSPCSANFKGIPKETDQCLKD